MIFVKDCYLIVNSILYNWLVSLHIVVVSFDDIILNPELVYLILQKVYEVKDCIAIFKFSCSYLIMTPINVL